jgi:hypothetical protein
MGPNLGEDKLSIAFGRCTSRRTFSNKKVQFPAITVNGAFKS